MDKNFSSAISLLPPRLQRYLLSVPDHVTSSATEIRLRTNSPIALTVRGRTVFLTENDPPFTDKEVMEQIFIRLCRNSVHTHRDEIAAGFITAPGGHRVGICGRAVTKDGVITSVTDISALNIRISRRHADTAKGLMPYIFGCAGLPSVLIYGAPLSGKTTVLRELAYLISERGIRVAVIDERNELAEKSEACMDVFSGYPRRQGIEQAIRLFSPNVIVFDELGSERDAESLFSAVNAGAAVITSAHAPDFESLKKRKMLSEAVNGGVFDLFVELSSGENLGRVSKIYNGDGEILEACGLDDDTCGMLYFRKNESVKI